MTTYAEKVLVRAKKLISSKDKWVKHRYQTKINGKKCYCAIGAIERVLWADTTKKSTNSKENTVINMSCTITFLYSVDRRYWRLLDFNDDKNTTHKMVMDEFDKMIENAKKVEDEKA